VKGYEALRESAAWHDLSERGRILAHGEDNARLLHAMSSNHVQGLGDGEGCYAFFLNAQGRIQADAYLLRVGADILIDTEPATKQTLFEHLDKFIIADDVTLESLNDSHGEIGIVGPKALQCGLPLPEKAPGILAHEGGYVVRLSDSELRWIHPKGTTPSLALEEADEDAWETVRLERAMPRYGVEILDKHLVQETRQMHGVHFSKGCYLGQEIVERVRARGQVHKGLSAILVESEVPPTAGDEIVSEGAKVGNMLSARWSPGEGAVVGFAMLSMDALSGSVPMQVGGAVVTLRKH
jgi:folate-binding protein YgfZ